MELQHVLAVAAVAQAKAELIEALPPGGVAIVPAPRTNTAAARAANVAFVPLSDVGSQREIGLAWSVERRLLPAAELFRSAGAIVHMMASFSCVGALDT